MQFGCEAVAVIGANSSALPVQVVSMPMMNITRNDWQLGQGGVRRWRFRYRLVFLDEPFDARQALREGQCFAVPPYLWVPGARPVPAGLEDLDIVFAGGPVLAFKVAEDGCRLILRLWNVVDQPQLGSLKLPKGYNGGQLCDALERPQCEWPVEDGRLLFEVKAGAVATLAFLAA